MQQSSIADRVRAYFAANPEEELTWSDVCIKFNCSRSGAESAIKRMKRDGLIEAHHVIRAARRKPA